jgi:hypothetical protein
MLYLKQSTAATIMFGPFVSSTDGVTLKTDSTTITDIDHASTGIFLSKAGAAAAIRHATVTASVADAYGMMKVTLDTTDTGTVGTLDVLFAKAATYLPVHKSFEVLPAQVYDSLMGTDLLQIDVTQLLGTGWLAPGTAGTPDVNVKLVGGTAQTAGDIIGDTNDIQARLPAALTANGNMKSSLVEILTTALTETAGLLAGAFKKFFNVSTPTGTINSLPDAVAGAANGLAIVGSVMGKSAATLAAADVSGNLPVDVKAQTVNADSAGVTEILTRVPDATAGAAGGLAIVGSQVDLVDAPNATAVTAIQSGLATATELGKVPKSDGTATWNATALADINAQVDAALNTAIPGTPTADSINERIVAIDAYGAPPAVGAIADAVWDEVVTTGQHDSATFAGKALLDAGGAGTPPTVGEIADAVWDEVLGTGAHDTATFAGKRLIDASGGGVALDAAGVRTAIGLATANLDTQLAALPTDADVNAACDTALSDYGALKPTVATRTLDVTATGAAGIDLGNVENPTTTLALSGTTVKAVTDDVGITQAGADKAWGTAARVLTAGTNIALAKGLGVTGFNDPTAAAIADAVLDEAAIGHTGVIATNLDAAVTSRLASGTVAADVTAIKGKTANLPEGVKKNTALAGFEFFMADAADHVTAKTGLTVAAERSIDGGAFAACANAPTEVSDGIYTIDLAASDLNGTVITLKFSATGADGTLITLKTTV